MPGGESELGRRTDPIIGSQADGEQGSFREVFVRFPLARPGMTATRRRRFGQSAP